MIDELYTQRSGSRTIPPLVRYFVSMAGTEEHSGPFTLAQLQGVWRQGKIDPHALVWEEGSEAWVSVQELASVLDAQSFDEYVASPRSGGPNKIRRDHSKKRRRSGGKRSEAAVKKQRESKKSRRAREKKRALFIQVGIIVAILLGVMASIAIAVYFAGKA